ncbi:MAG: DMT family transporter [Methyloligellaceae bacterium]
MLRKTQSDDGGDAPSGRVAGSAARVNETGKAVAFMLAGSALLTINDALVKALASSYPAGQVLFIRGMFVLPWIFLAAFFMGGLRALKIKSFKGQALRGTCVIASAFLFITGLTLLPLAEAIAAAFTGPLFITAMAPLVLGEVVGWRRRLAVLAGFVGVLFMVRPGSGALQWAIIFPLCAAMFGGMRDLITRRISQSETTLAVLFTTTTIVAMAGLATSSLGWEVLKLDHLPHFAASGFLLAGAHYAMIEAFRLGEAAIVAPFKYTSLIWAILLGFLMFGDLPDGWTLAGAGIIIAAGLYILERERALKKKARPVTAVGPSARL